jgi:hypothetical protein
VFSNSILIRILLVVGRKMIPQRCPQLMLGNCEYVILHGKRALKVRLLKILTWGDDSIGSRGRQDSKSWRRKRDDQSENRVKALLLGTTSQGM